MERPDEAACVSGLVARLCSLLRRTPHTSVSRRGASVHWWPTLCSFHPEGTPLTPWLCRPGGLEIPWALCEARAAEGASHPAAYPKGTIKTLGRNTPQSFWEGSLFSWRGGLTVLQHSQGPAQMLPRGWRLVDVVFRTLPCPRSQHLTERSLHLLSEEPWFLWLLCQEPPVLSPGPNVQQDFCFQVPQDCNQ